MKSLLHTILLAVVLTGCTSKSDPAPDPFLGQWQSESFTSEELDATGRVLDPVATSFLALKFVVTPTTIQTTAGTGTTAVTGDPSNYTRNGEVLTFTSSGPPCCGIIRRTYVRSLTPDTFTYELRITSPDGSVRITRHPFHR